MRHSHPLREPRTDRCSCCLETIYPGSNVVQVNKVPENILNEKGEVIGKGTISGPQGIFHAECFQIHLGLPSPMACKYCGVFKMAKTVRAVDPKTADEGRIPIEAYCASVSPNGQPCQCHTGRQYECSAIRLYQGSEKALGDDATFEKWRESQKK